VCASEDNCDVTSSALEDAQEVAGIDEPELRSDRSGGQVAVGEEPLGLEQGSLLQPGAGRTPRFALRDSREVPNGVSEC